MTRQRQILAVLFAGTLVYFVSVGLTWWFAPPRLNVLLITLDTARADRLGCYGYQPALTPALDDLAGRGVLFERASTAVPLTLPAHATLLTGLYPPEHGLHYNGQNSLDPEIPTLPETLCQRGYQTAAFIGALVLRAKFGLARGFQVYDDDMHGAEPVADHLDRMRSGEAVVDAALTWLRRQSPEKPFFCWVHLYDPHHPYLAHEELFGRRFRDQPYDGEIAYVDRQIERLVADLKARGLAERTMIVVAGDHGESLGEHGEATHAYMLYEATLHVPLIISAPQSSSGGKRVSVPVSLCDVYPTILDCLGLQPPKAVNGRTLKPAFQGKDLEPGACYGETDQPYGEFQFAPLKSLTTGRWKYIRTPQVELYDLNEDPYELHNLAATDPDQVQELDRQLTDLQQRMSHRTAPAAHLSAHEQRALESLGYAGGNSRQSDTSRFDNLPDIKDMIEAVSQYNEALSLMAAEKYAQAEAILRAIAASRPDLFVVHHNLGVCLTAQKRDDQALLSFHRALEVRDDAQTHIELAKLCILLSRPQAAIPHLEAARHQLPDSPKPPFYWGEALRHLGQKEQAREQYYKALRLQPGFVPAQRALRHMQVERR